METDDKKGRAGKAMNGPGQQNPGATVDYDLSQARWDQEFKHHAGRAWQDSPQGRATIRLFSRGVLGASGFALGGWYARRSTGLKGYSPETWNKKMPLHWVAKFFDTVAGKPIKGIVNALGFDGERAVRFRASASEFSPGKTGRTLGEEVVGVSTDFSFMSWFDALGRDLWDLADPNVKKDWIRDDGSIDTGKVLKNTGKALWRYTTYNAGEDWVVGLPYVYWMKGTRHVWNKRYPGFKYDFDRSFNGGSSMVNRNGDLTGNYNIPGLLNFQERFTAYNIGTLMYREFYNHAGHLLKGRPSRLYGAPNESDPPGIIDNVGRTLKWAARSAVKGGLYMTPVVPFFWITRVPQSKYKGEFINSQDESLLCFHLGGDEYDAMHAHEYKIQGLKANPTFRMGDPVQFRRYDGQHIGWHNAPTPNPYHHPLSPGHFDPYAHTFGPIDKGLNAVGRLSERGRQAVQWLPKRMGLPISNVATSRWWNAAVSYTPYMWAKAEAANMWDTGKMDVAAERLVDGAFGLNWGEFKAGAAEVMYALAHEPLPEPERERIAQERIHIRTTPADEFFLESEGALQQRRRFAERLRPHGPHASGTPTPHVSVSHMPPQEEQPLTLLTAPPSVATHAEHFEQGRTRAEKLAMRKLLEDAEPPTKSLN